MSAKLTAAATLMPEVEAGAPEVEAGAPETTQQRAHGNFTAVMGLVFDENGGLTEAWKGARFNDRVRAVLVYFPEYLPCIEKEVRAVLDEFGIADENFKELANDLIRSRMEWILGSNTYDNHPTASLEQGGDGLSNLRSTHGGYENIAALQRRLELLAAEMAGISFIESGYTGNMDWAVHKGTYILGMVTAKRLEATSRLSLSPRKIVRK